MSVVKGQDHTIGSVFHWFVSYSYHINQTNNSLDTAVWTFDIAYPISNRCTSFSFHINQTNHFWDIAQRVFDLEKHTYEMCNEKSLHKVFNSISRKSDQVISIIRGINIPSFIVIRWVVRTLSWRQSKYLLITISSLIQTYIFLVQICNIWHNQFRRERQNSLQCRTRRRKRTKNIESRQTWVT